MQRAGTLVQRLATSSRTPPVVIEGAAMLKDRRIERHELQYFLQVFNRYTDRTMGCLGNVSEDGLMLISDLPMLVGGRFDLRLKVPSGNDGFRMVDVSATCQWCHEDVTPGCYDSGFHIQEAAPEYFELMHSLQHYFSFYPLEASA